MTSEFSSEQSTFSFMENKNKSKARKVIADYDDFVEVIGEFGSWQKLICFLLWLPSAALSIHVLIYSFTGLSPEKYRY